MEKKKAKNCFKNVDVFQLHIELTKINHRVFKLSIGYWPFYMSLTLCWLLSQALCHLILLTL